jgi:glutamate synthase (NADPH/NADH) small chain
MDEMDYEAVFVGTGAGLPRFLKLPGENLNGVYSANEFLTRINLMGAYRFPDYDTPVKSGRRVAVIGAGNTAMDAARCAMRAGSEEVTVVYRRSDAEMTARVEEYEHAIEEGVQFKWLNNPIEFLDDGNGWVSGMRCQRMELGEPDEDGRRRPVPVEGSEYVLDVNNVIVAIGTSPNPLLSRTTPGLDTTKWGGLVAEDDTGQTSREGVFAGGDIVTGAATVILAAGAGKRAAAAIDRYLTEKRGETAALC